MGKKKLTVFDLFQVEFPKVRKVSDIMSKSASKKVAPLPSIGAFERLSLEPDVKRKLGEEIAASYHANLEVVTLPCTVCKIKGDATLKFAVVVRVSRAGTPVYLPCRDVTSVSNRSEIPDVYIVPLRELSHEKSVLLGSQKTNKVCFMHSCISCFLSHFPIQ